MDQFIRSTDRADRSTRDLDSATRATAKGTERTAQASRRAARAERERGAAHQRTAQVVAAAAGTTDSRLEGARRAMDAFVRSTERAEKKARDLHASTTRAARGVERQASVGTIAADRNRQLEGARRAVDAFFRSTDRAERKARDLDRTMRSASGGSERSATSLRRLATDVQNTATATERAERSARRAARAESERAKAHRRAARTAKDAAAGTDLLRRSVTRAVPKLASYSSTLRRVSSLGTALAGALGARAVAQTAQLEVALNLQANAIGVATSKFRNFTTLYGVFGSRGDRVRDQVLALADAIEGANQNVDSYLRAFRAVGVEWRNADGSARPVIDVFDSLGESAGRLGQITPELADAFRTIFRARSAAEFLAIWKRSREEIESIQGTLSKADEAGEEFRKEWFQINFAIAQVRDAMAGLFLEAFGRNAETINKLSNAVIQLAEFAIPKLAAALTFAANNGRVLFQVLATLASAAVLGAMGAVAGAVVNIGRALLTATRTSIVFRKALLRTGIGIAAVAAGWLVTRRLFADFEDDLVRLEAELNDVANEAGAAGAAVEDANPFWEQWQNTLKRANDELEFFNLLASKTLVDGRLAVGPRVLNERLDEMIDKLRQAATGRARLQEAWNNRLEAAGLPTAADVERITEMNAVMTTLGNSVSSTFARWATGATRARDAMRALLAQIAQFFIRREALALLGRLGLIQPVPQLLALPVGGGSTVGAATGTVPVAGFRGVQGAAAGAVGASAVPVVVNVNGVSDPHVVASQVRSVLQSDWRADIARAGGR